MDEKTKNEHPIRTARKRCGLTQHQFSELTGVPFRTLQNWESGVNQCPDYVQRLLIAELDRTFPESVESG